MRRGFLLLATENKKATHAHLVRELVQEVGILEFDLQTQTKTQHNKTRATSRAAAQRQGWTGGVQYVNDA